MHVTGCSGLVHWDDPEGWDGEGDGRGGSGWGTHVHSWQIHVNVWQNQYNIVKFKKKETKIMTSGPITSWQIDRETMETLTGFLFLGSKITPDGNCTHEIESLLFGRKVITNLDRVLKSRDITLLKRSI